MAQKNPDLTEEQKRVLFEGATEPPFSGALLHNKTNGLYRCANCSAVLFSSEHKFDSGSGWPSFYDVHSPSAVRLLEDRSHGMVRVEVRCGTCDAHLGHVFNDAKDQPTGVRFCINSVSMDFEKK